MTGVLVIVLSLPYIGARTNAENMSNRRSIQFVAGEF